MEREKIIEKMKRTLECVYRDEPVEAEYALAGFYATEYGKACANDIGVCGKLAEEFADDSDGKRKERLLTLIVSISPDRYDGLGIRVCTHCGKTMDEGYVLGCEYACSEDCAVKIYMESGYDCDKAREVLESDLQYDDENCVGEVYYTDWK